MFKKIISYTMTLAIALSMGINVSARDMDLVAAISLDDINFVMPDKQILSKATLTDEFSDNSIIVIFTSETSRNNRNFTADDFSDIGAAKIEDVTRLSNKEYNYIDPVWTAQSKMETLARKDMTNRNIKEGQISSATREAVIQYEAVKEVAVENTLVNIDEFRRSLLITLAKPGKENVLRAVEMLQKRDDIRYVGPNYTGGQALLSTTPNDPRRGEQYAINRIKLPEAWNVTTGSETINVGVIDTGINGNHDDLKNRVNIQLSRDFSGANTNGLVDTQGHGTHVSGIIGAQGNNGIGITGANWNVRLVSLRALETAYWGPLGNAPVAMAVNHARINNIPILNASLEIGTNNTENQAIRDAVTAYSGLFIQAAGNGYSNTNNNPKFAGFSNVIVVGATDQNDNRSSFSDYGSTSTHLFAPGSNILSTDGNGYSNKNGTSMAAPYVAGVAALLAGRHPSLTTAQIRTSILENIDQLPQLSGLATTGGRLNANSVLNSFYDISVEAVTHYPTTTTAGGEVTGNGIYARGGNVKLTATSYDKYTFDGWYNEKDVDENGGIIGKAIPISDKSEYIFTANANQKLKARFVRTGGSATPVYIMAASGFGGTATGGDMYSEGDTVTLIATPDPGYNFIGWYEDNIRINDAGATYSFVAEDFRILEARFLMQSGYDLPVFILAMAGPGGTVTGTDLYYYGDIVYLTATPDPGYTFDGWYENGAKVNGAGATYSFAAEDYRELEARFTGLD